MSDLTINTDNKRQVIDITESVAKQLKPPTNGLMCIFSKHTTAAITIADLDPGTDLDFLDFLEAITPNINWRHPHNPAHAPDHLLTSLIGPSVAIPVKQGKPQLGTWQRIILVEFDGPRERQIELTLAS